MTIIFSNGDNNMGEKGSIQLVDKEDIRKKAKSKRERYGYLKDKIVKLVPWIDGEIKKAHNGEIVAKARDFAKGIDLENKSDYALYSGLRFLLFYEGIDLSIKNNGNEILFVLRKLDGGRSEGLPGSIIKTFDNMELDGWYIKRNYDYLIYKHSIRKEYNKEDKDDIYILESEGNVCFDQRSLTDEQALEFVKYISGKEMHAPDFVYLTPINVVMPDEYLKENYRFYNFDVDKIGKEFRIVKSIDNSEGERNEGERNGEEIRYGGGSEFIVTSIYGRECSIYEYDVDSIIKGGSLRSIISGFEKSSEMEKVPERIDVLKKIIPGIKTKNSMIIQGKRLVINNSSGTFNLSLIDATLHKIYDDIDMKKNIREGIHGRYGRERYICVGPIGNKSGSIIYNGVRHDIDRTTDAILSKMKMLLEEKYPDKSTEMQVKI